MVLAGVITAASAAVLVTGAAMGGISILGFGGNAHHTSLGFAPASTADTQTTVIHRSRNVYDNFVVSEPTTAAPAVGSSAGSSTPNAPAPNAFPAPAAPAPVGAPTPSNDNATTPSDNNPAPPSRQPSATAPPTTTGPAATDPPTAAPPTTLAPSVPASVSTPDGTINVTVSGTTITVVSVKPAPGYDYDVGRRSNGTPLVHFETNGPPPAEMCLMLTVVNGQVQATHGDYC
jgi:hypothetical protein